MAQNYRILECPIASKLFKYSLAGIDEDILVFADSLEKADDILIYWYDEIYQGWNMLTIISVMEMPHNYLTLLQTRKKIENDLSVLS